MSLASGFKVYEPHRDKRFLLLLGLVVFMFLVTFFIAPRRRFQQFNMVLTISSNSGDEVEVDSGDGTVTVEYDNGTGSHLELEELEDSGDQKLTKPVILMWSSYYEVKGDALLNLIFKGREWDPSCCKDNAEITLDRGRLLEASVVVIFHYFGQLSLKDLPPKRTPEQLWVLFSKESPRHATPLRKFNNLFNLTMSYRRDSDIWSPYGLALELEEPLAPSDPIRIGNSTLEELMETKEKLITGVISHCRTSSKREKLVEAMRKEGNITVDIYGACGIKVCPRYRAKCKPNNLWGKLAKEYKFYFAAENSLCFDYITEKFWRTLEIGLVPVVYGAGNYSFEAPPGSFIDARDFGSPKELAKFLEKVGSDREEYKKYFEWRRKYEVRVTDAWQGWCDLCQFTKTYLESDPRGWREMVHRNLSDWWDYAPKGEGDESVRGKRRKVCSKPLWNL